MPYYHFVVVSLVTNGSDDMQNNIIIVLVASVSGDFPARLLSIYDPFSSRVSIDASSLYRFRAEICNIEWLSVNIDSIAAEPRYRSVFWSSRIDHFCIVFGRFFFLLRRNEIFVGDCVFFRSSVPDRRLEIGSIFTEEAAIWLAFRALFRVKCHFCIK